MTIDPKIPPDASHRVACAVCGKHVDTYEWERARFNEGHIVRIMAGCHGALDLAVMPWGDFEIWNSGRGQTHMVVPPILMFTRHAANRGKPDAVHTREAVARYMDTRIGQVGYPSSDPALPPVWTSYLDSIKRRAPGAKPGGIPKFRRRLQSATIEAPAALPIKPNRPKRIMDHE